MYYLNPTHKFLAITVNHPAGWSASDYVPQNASGHVYYKNNPSDPWGNDGVHLGSFNLRQNGPTTFIVGNPALLTGNLLNNPTLSNKQKYTPICNLITPGNLDLHFLTIVIDRPKPPEKAQTNCPCYVSPGYGFPGNKAICPPANMLNLTSYNHGQVTVNIVAYYINSTYNLSAGTQMSLNFWNENQLSIVANNTCGTIKGITPGTSRERDESNNAEDLAPNRGEWLAGNVLMPEHRCDPFCPDGYYFGAFRYWNGGNSPAGPTRECGCITADVYSHKNSTHYWGNSFSVDAVGSTFIRNGKITTTNGAYGGITSSAYYTNSAFYDSIYSSNNWGGGSGLYQCPINTGQDRAFAGQIIQTVYNILAPRYKLDISPKCNRGARTDTQDPYYVSNNGRYGGYGFYMKFEWDALCYPCS